MPQQRHSEYLHPPMRTRNRQDTAQEPLSSAAAAVSSVQFPVSAGPFLESSVAKPKFSLSFVVVHLFPPHHCPPLSPPPPLVPSLHRTPFARTEMPRPAKGSRRRRAALRGSRGSSVALGRLGRVRKFGGAGPGLGVKGGGRRRSPYRWVAMKWWRDSISLTDGGRTDHVVVVRFLWWCGFGGAALSDDQKTHIRSWARSCGPTCGHASRTRSR